MSFRKAIVSVLMLTSIVQIPLIYSVSKEERLTGINVVPDGPQFDARILANGYEDCMMNTNGEFFVFGMLRPDDILADVGANVGEWSLHAFNAQPSVSICCFEPIPALHPTLEANLAGRNVLFGHFALSDNPGRAIFSYYPTQPHLSSLHRRADEMNHNITPVFISVELQRLDTFCQNNRVPRINVMKIDVEGNEFYVMKGAEELLKNRKIDVIQFEYAWTFLDGKSTLKEVHDFLTGYDFTIYRLAPWGLIEITEWRDALENYYFCNYVAVRNTDEEHPSDEG